MADALYFRHDPESIFAENLAHVTLEDAREQAQVPDEQDPADVSCPQPGIHDVAPAARRIAHVLRGAR